MLPGANPLSFTKVLFGISRTLKIVQNIMPIYTNLKPVIEKIPNVIERLSSLNQTSRLLISNNYSQNDTENKNADNSGPNFFV